MKLKKTKKNAIFVLVTTVILVVYFLPNYYARFSTPEGKVYTGQASWFDPWDINVYVAAINWSQENGLNFQNAFTTSAHKSILIYPLYIFEGILFPQFSPYLIYSTSSLVFGFILLVSIYRVSGVFVSDNKAAVASVLLVSLGGGLGWLAFPQILSPDIAITPFSFASAFQKPHEAIATAFYLLSFSLFFVGIKRKDLKATLGASLFLNLLIFFYPYYLFSNYIIFFFFSLLFALKNNRKYPIKYFFLVLVTTLPIGVIYSIYLLSGSGFEDVLSPALGKPSPLSVALGYGILLPVLVLQLFKKRKSDEELFLNLWFFLSILFVYFPFSFSRYYLRGLFFPVVMLSLLSLDPIAKLFKISKRVVLWIFIFTVPLSGVFINLQRMVFAKSATNPWYYFKDEVALAFEYLNTKSPSQSGVLASYRLGNFIPAYTHNRVYFGHYFQTPNSKEKIENLTKFYSNEFSEREAKQFLIKNNISYVVWGQDEKEITKSSEDSEMKYKFLKVAYSNPEVTVFSY